MFFHSWAPGCAPLDSLACQYHQGALSMRVSRKGQVVSALEADWLELTAAYYRKGWSLVDSFVYWDTPKGWFGVEQSTSSTAVLVPDELRHCRSNSFYPRRLGPSSLAMLAASVHH